MTFAKVGNRNISNGTASYTPLQTSYSSQNFARLFPLYCLIALFLCGFGPPTIVDRDVAPRQRYTVGQLRQIQMAQRPPPDISAVSVLVYDVGSRRDLMKKAAHLQVSPASLAKLMTALLVLERDQLSERVTIRQADLVGEATMGLNEGEELSVEELLWGLLIPSGNDAAMALARQHSGQVEAFVKQMNLRAEDLGMHDTLFQNPNGFDADGQVSSARDMLTLVELLWEFPLFREIVGTSSATVANKELKSTNRLLGSYPGANGVKTGTTLQSGQSLIAGVDENGHQLFALVLGSVDRYQDMRLILQAVQRNYTWVPLRMPERPTALDRLFDAEGGRWYLRADGISVNPAVTEKGPFFEALLAAWERKELQVFRRLDPLPSGMWATGVPAGVLEWRLGDTVVATQRIYVQ